MTYPCLLFGLNRFAALAFVLQDIQRCLIDNAADLFMQRLLQLGHHRRQRSLLHHPVRITTKRIRTDLLVTHTQHRFQSIHGDASCHGYADFYGQILRNRRLRCYRNRRIVRHMQVSLPTLANVQVVVGIEVAQKFCRAFIECAQKVFLGSEVAPRIALAAVRARKSIRADRTNYRRIQLGFDGLSAEPLRQVIAAKRRFKRRSCCAPRSNVVAGLHNTVLCIALRCQFCPLLGGLKGIGQYLFLFTD